ncbi:DUF3137 domain-containing protein [Campylobacter ureolyticus]|uniref:DUF3137 domain-containing protein n=1 Tax=Campylobacter ureolyticus TaxID=827 RepID=UPI0022B2F982|nr:DUF3137 domain-containing protein [Campylobacter ureolyticus]MCZ6135331.1 DUF3137 domain-containing protein [Campylobacter ureolyticus]
MKLIELEKQRKKLLEKELFTKIYIFFLTFLIVGVTYFSFVSGAMFFTLKEWEKISQNSKFITFFIFFVILILFYLRYLKNYKRLVSLEFRQNFKEFYLKPFIEKKGFKYEMKRHIKADIIKHCGLFPMFNDEGGNDLISGKINGVKFKFSDIILQDYIEPPEVEGKISMFYYSLSYLFYSKNFRYEDWRLHKYTGLFFVADFNKTITSNTYIMSNKAPKSDKKLQKILTDNYEFNKNFKIYTDDIINAMYILSPALMESIIKIKNRFKVPINLSFLGSKIYIAINTDKDNFEPNLNQNLITKNPAKKILNDLNTILQIVEILSLNKNIFKF